MQINYNQLNNLPVYTESQQFIGRIGDVAIDIDAHTIKQYIVKKSSLVKELLSALSQEKDLEVSPQQVVSITKDKMIVHDSVASDKIKLQEKSKATMAMPATLSQANER